MELIKYAPVKITVNLKEATTKDLREELAKSLTMTAKHLLYLSEVWRELELRGENLSDLKSGLGEYLPQIAAGTLRAEAVIKFAGQKMLLKKISTLPQKEQLRLAADGMVPVVDNNQGKLHRTEKRCAQLSSSQIQTIFGENYIRGYDEQIAVISSKAKTKRGGSVAKFRINPKTRGAKVGRSYIKRGDYRVSVSEIVDALSEYYGIDLEKLIEKHAPKLKP